MMNWVHKNKEGYMDQTAGDAIREADKPPRMVLWYIKMIKDLADLVDLDVIGRIAVRDKKTGRWYR